MHVKPRQRRCELVSENLSLTGIEAIFWILYSFIHSFIQSLWPILLLIYRWRRGINSNYLAFTKKKESKRSQEWFNSRKNLCKGDQAKTPLFAGVRWRSSEEFRTYFVCKSTVILLWRFQEELGTPGEKRDSVKLQKSGPHLDRLLVDLLSLYSSLTRYEMDNFEIKLKSYQNWLILSWDRRCLGVRTIFRLKESC